MVPTTGHLLFGGQSVPWEAYSGDTNEEIEGQCPPGELWHQPCYHYLYILCSRCLPISHIFYILPPDVCLFSLSVTLALQARVQSEQEEREKEFRAREEAVKASHLQREAELQQKIATLTNTVRSLCYCGTSEQMRH